MAKYWENFITTIKREKLITISNICIMSITFLLLGAFFYIVVLTQTAIHLLEQQAQVTIFFKDDFIENNILTLKSTLETDSRVASVKYVSKSEAFKIFTQLHKDKPILLGSASQAILPASIQIRTKKVSNLSQIAQEFSTFDGVEEARFSKDVISKFKYWSTVVYIIGTVFVGIFLIISYTIIISTLRTMITSKGQESEILRLVGASDKYVKNPLIFQSTVLGFTAAFISGTLLLILSLLAHRFGFLTGTLVIFSSALKINSLFFSLIMFAVLILSGIVLGFFGGWSGVKKYLNY